MPGNRKAREDLDAKSSKLAEMEADYGDVVPRRDFERLEAQFTVSNVNLPASLYTGNPESSGIPRGKGDPLSRWQ